MNIKRKMHKVLTLISACKNVFCFEILMKLNKPLCGDYRKLKVVASWFIKKFKKYKEYNERMNIKGLSNLQVVSFAFVVYSSSMWNLCIPLRKPQLHGV